MNIDVTTFRIAKRGAVDLADRPTAVEPVYGSKHDYRKLLAEHVEHLAMLQERLYAQSTNAVLVIFQAMDAAGKDGAIKHVMSGVNPQGCQVFSFKAPGPEELQHDFIWRSYYEDVLIARVHPEILRQRHLMGPDADLEAVFEGRYRSIRQYEKHLVRNSTAVVKIFLHLSFEEQRRRFLERIDQVEKNWKLSLSDMQERRFWPQYVQAYERAIGATSTRVAPWHVVPADDKKNARLIVSKIILKAIEDLNPTPPKATPQAVAALQAFRDELERG